MHIMTERATGFEVDFGPPYRLTQDLPGDGHVFASALVASQKILSVPANQLEERHGYDGIPCDNEFIPAEFRGFIPGTTFSKFDISVPYQTKLGTSEVFLRLHDTQNPRRTIEIKPGDQASHPDILRIADTYPNRQPRSAKSIGHEAVRSFLAWQLQALGHDDLVFFQKSFQLGMQLGQYRRGPRHKITTGETKISDTRVLHTERDETYATNSDGEPTGIVHSTWLTGLLDDEAIQMGVGFRIRTIARFNGNDVLSPRNSLQYEIEAEQVDDPEDFTRRIVMVQREKRLLTTRVFGTFLRDYLQRPPQAP